MILLSWELQEYILDIQFSFFYFLIFSTIRYYDPFTWQAQQQKMTWISIGTVSHLELVSWEFYKKLSLKKESGVPSTFRLKGGVQFR